MCESLKVNNHLINNVKTSKYLGDILSNDGKHKVNVLERKRKAIGIISDVFAILDELPLASKHVETGLLLRQTVLLSSLLFNTESVGNYTESDINAMEAVDNIFLSNLITKRQKTSISFLHLETATLPIRFILASRQVNYFHHIITRDSSELINRVFRSMVKSPLPGDWIHRLYKSLTLIGMTYDEEFIKSFSKQSFKKYVKKKTTTAAFSFLLKLKITNQN